MKKWILCIFCLALVLCLVGCGGETTQAQQVETLLQSEPWWVDMTEATSARYTFEKNGRFCCDITVQSEAGPVSLSNSGAYTVMDTEDGVKIYLMYEDASYQVEILCSGQDGDYRFVIADCEMYRKSES